MTKPIDIKAIEKGTGKTWNEWLAFFETINAKDLTHHEIAVKVYEYLLALRPSMLTQVEAQAQSRSPSGGLPRASVEWWSQNVTVAYEQHIGRRAPGQRSDGKYEVSVTKTIDGSLDDAMKWWQGKVKDLDEFSGITFADAPKQSKTDKWRHWRVDLRDGSKVAVSTNQKTPGKAQLAVTSQKLASSEDVEHWRAYWKQFLT